MQFTEEMISKSHTIAVVGLSPKPDRPSHQVARYLKEHGYRIIPVNPAVAEVLGEKSYPDLRSVPEPIDLVNIFRRSEVVLPVVEEAIEVGVKHIWMQDGVINQKAADKAMASGLLVVMDNCIMRQHKRPYGERVNKSRA